MAFQLRIRPTLVTKQEASAVAHRHGGRLMYPKELLKLANRIDISIDIWTQNATDESGYAQYFDAEKQFLKQKPSNEKCLLVYFIDLERVKKMQEEASSKKARIKSPF